ncbi:MAG: carboxypeptidase-like regulatory domain-containing protein [Planctomycetaceae bacterium]|jgi:hypothetical protein|nr:carboxypeptidase-like regulatory domain-containing protein [Planctomycetaceae bacterium]
MEIKKFFCVGILFWAGMILMVSGCDNPAPANVTGTVTFDGKPLPQAMVIFSPVDGSRSSVGVTDAQGTYKLRFSASASGAIVGEHKVEIRTATTDPDPSDKTKAVEIIPARYNNSTELRQILKKGTQVINFDISSQ